MVHRTLVGALVIVALAAASGCGDADDDPLASPTAADNVVDERTGTWRGIGLGSTERQIIARLGEPSRQLRSISGEDSIGVPRVIEGPPVPRKPYEPWRTVAYPGLLFEYAINVDDAQVYEMLIVRDGTRTKAGAHIGQSLDDAAARYPGMKCFQVKADHNRDDYRYCVKRLARDRWLALGYDPVRSIMISRYELG